MRSIKRVLGLCLLASLLASPCGAAWAHVQTSGNVEAGADANVAVSMGSNVTSGSLLVCSFVWSASSFSSIADTRSNTWTIVDTELSPGSVFFLRAYYAMNSSAGADTITVTFTDALASDKAIICGEYSGVATSSALDQVKQQEQSNPGTGTDAISSTATASTATAPQLAIGIGFVRSGFTSLTAGTSGSWTKRNQQDETFYALAHEDRNVSSTSTVTAFWTASDASNETACQVATFKEPAAGGAATGSKLLLGAGK